MIVSITPWALGCLGPIAAAAVAATPAATLEGEWINQAGSVIVRIAPCETGLCAIVSWASDVEMPLAAERFR